MILSDSIISIRSFIKDSSSCLDSSLTDNFSKILLKNKLLSSLICLIQFCKTLSTFSAFVCSLAIKNLCNKETSFSSILPSHVTQANKISNNNVLSITLISYFCSITFFSIIFKLISYLFVPFYFRI